MRHEDRRFHNGEHVLCFWHEFGQLVEEFGMPSLALNDEIVIGGTPRAWDYPDWWYDWMTIDRAVQQLPKKDRAPINDFFKQGYQHSKHNFEEWKHYSSWLGITQRVFRLVPEECKFPVKERKRWRKMQ